MVDPRSIVMVHTVAKTIDKIVDLESLVRWVVACYILYGKLMQLILDIFISLITLLFDLSLCHFFANDLILLPTAVKVENLLDCFFIWLPILVFELDLLTNEDILLIEDLWVSGICVLCFYLVFLLAS